VKVKPAHVLAVLGLAAAGGVAYLATRSVGPVRMPAFSENRVGGLAEHLVTDAELLTAPVYTPHYYPAGVMPAVSAVVAHGFAPGYRICDPQAAGLPAEKMW
jgi:hypothetical protein